MINDERSQTTTVFHSALFTVSPQADAWKRLKALKNHQQPRVPVNEPLHYKCINIRFHLYFRELCVREVFPSLLILPHIVQLFLCLKHTYNGRPHLGGAEY